MGSLSIHGLDPEIEAKLRRLARDEGRSLNKTIKRILTEALGGSRRDEKRAYFERFHGKWSEAETDAFLTAIEPLSRVDAEDWE